MTKYLLAIWVLLAFLSRHETKADPAKPAQRPNIILIFTDDHAYQSISAYGSRINKTPHMDRIAAEGMRFDRCLVNNSLCGPSRACILTGKYSHKNGFYRNGNRFDGSQQTFPKLLQAAGYQTAMIGKWHLSSDPTGFDHWEVLIDQGPYWNPPMIRNGTRVQHTGYTTDIIGDLTLAWLKDQRQKDKPFLLMFQHKAPHREWQPHPRHYKLYDDVDIPEPATLFDDYEGRASPARKQQMEIANDMSALDLKLTPPRNLTPEQLKLWTDYYGPIKEQFEKDKPEGKELTRWQYQRYIKDYLRCVQAVDENIGRLLAYLDDSGLAKNTVVVYASDQGFYLGEHGWYDKRWMYEESLRTPLLVRWPGVIKPGGVSKDIVANVDFAETFLEIAGVEVPKDMQGRSLVPIFKGTVPADWRKSFYYHYYEFPDSHAVARHYGVTTDRYKLIHYYRENEWELFDLQKDPSEMKSVYADPAYASVVLDLKSELARLQKELDDTEPTKAVPGEPQPRQPGAAPKRTPGKGKGVKPQKPEQAVSMWEEKSQVFHGDMGVKAAVERPAIAAKAFAVGGSVLPLAENGVIAAQGGVAMGFSLYIANGVPHFAVRADGAVTTIADKAKLALKDWHHVAGVLDEKETMRLYVDGKEVASEEAAAIPRVPAEGLSIGEDAESLVTDYKTNAFKGELKQLRLYLGPLSEKELAAWIEGKTALTSPAQPAAVEDAASPFSSNLDSAAAGEWWKRQPKQPWLNLKVERDKVIGFCLYTVHRNILKLTAQLYPLYPGEPREVRLETQQPDGAWKQVATAKVNDLGWSATFRVEKWDSTKDAKYRVLHGEKASYEGLVRRDPVEKDVVTVAVFTGNSNRDRGDRDSIVRNVKAQDPDLLFFSGDQVYDHKEHTASWLVFGRQFGEVMRDRPTITIPDDHDVGLPNLWGENGKQAMRADGSDGGYYWDVAYVQMVERCQTAHLPDPYDPTPIQRGIGVYYTSMNVGGIDFAIIEDRKFKTGPAGKIPQQGPRPDHINDPKYDPKTIDVKGLELLGDRQIRFIREWAQDWTGAEMKAVLSQTIFCGGAHLHGTKNNRLHADLDSNGWPQTGRDAALREIRKAFAIHLAGDQHIGTFIHQGVDAHRDSIYSFCTPAILNTIYSRWWWPAEGAGKNRDLNSPLPFTGDYLDGFDNKVTMLAYANPEISPDAGSGYGLALFDKRKRTITAECWPRFADVTKPDAKQFVGWPITVAQMDNYNRKPAAHLPTLKFSGIARPVVQVVEEATGEVVYTLRIAGDSFRPKVFTVGAHTIRVGREQPGEKELKGVKPGEEAIEMKW